MARLPVVNGDDGTWGDILNDYLSQSHKSDGTLRDNAVTSNVLAPGSVSKAFVGLGNVDNTSDINKPISSATQTALNAKQNTPTGTADGTKFLRDDNSWQPIPAATDATRTGVFQFEHPNSLLNVGPYAISTRRPFSIPHAPGRFRVHIRNRDFLGDTDSNGSLSSFAMYIGEAVKDSNGELTGATVASPVQIGSTTTLPGSGELTTAWISPSTFQISPYKTYFLTYPINVASGKNLAVGGGLHFYTTTPSDAAVANPAGLTRVDNQGVLDIYIEYEFADDLAPVVMFVGPSVVNGGNVGGVANRAELGAFPMLWAMREKGVAASLAIGGSWAAHYGASSAKWDYYNTLNAPLSVDAVQFFALNSSDICAGTGSATVRANYINAINKARSLWPTARIIISTNPPRGDSTGTPETTRISENTWLATCPAGVNHCIEISAQVTDWASPERLRSIYAAAPPSADIIHWSQAAHSLASNLIPVRYGAVQAA